MWCVVWIHLCFVLVLINNSSAELTISSSCQSYCGDISIPYPFGIGNGCYLNEWYEVQCNNSTSRRFVPFLPKINKEVVKIDLPSTLKYGDESNLYGSLRIKTKITSTGCSGGEGENSEEVLDFTESPFTIGDNNNLMAFGCNNKATLTKIDPTLVGCISTCDQPSTYSNRSCDGYGCCSASTPYLEIGDGIGVKIESVDGNKTREGCNVAFVTDEYDQSSLWQNRTTAKKLHALKYATMQLKWEVLTNNLSFLASLGCREELDDLSLKPCYCEVDSYIDVRCACYYGYEGNPYILNGCKESYRESTKTSKTFLIYIGVSIGLSVLMVGALTWLYIFIKKYRKTNRRKKFFKRNGGLLLQQQLASREGYVEKTILFSSTELEKATEGFSLDRVIGHGGQGTVFKGMLANGTIVAVKRSKVVDEDKLDEFINEVFILSQINHRNIVNILGCCLETEVPVLVYEFIPNGNLFQLLHETDDHTLITWELRLRIAIDTAGALSYLHSAAASPIYHRDVKSANILLDENYRAKVSDFGTSRSLSVDQTHLTTLVVGTVGYVDPEYFQSGQFTEKSDTYSFGIVLVELITGEKPVSFQRSGENRTLATYFNLAVKEKRLFDIIDSRIRNDCKLGQVTVLAKLARRCLNLKGRKRPSMREALLQLESLAHGGGLQAEEEYDEEEENVLVNTFTNSLNIDLGASTSQQFN